MITYHNSPTFVYVYDYSKIAILLSIRLLRLIVVALQDRSWVAELNSYSFHQATAHNKNICAAKTAIVSFVFALLADPLF